MNITNQNKMSKEQKKEILRLVELSYNLGQDNIRTGIKVSLVDLYKQFEDRLNQKEETPLCTPDNCRHGY